MPPESSVLQFQKRLWPVQAGNLAYSHLALLEREFSNAEYLYEHLPARYRRDDRGELLRRFLTPAGDLLDSWDDIFDGFDTYLNPDTAPEEFLTWWLWAIFGWGWYPEGYTLAQKRNLFKRMAVLYARRGTKPGIEEFLKAFGVAVEVFDRPAIWGEAVWGAHEWSIAGPLGIVVRIYPVKRPAGDQVAWGEAVVGESPWAGGYTLGAAAPMTRADVESLIEFVAPGAHIIMIEDVMTI